MKRLFFWLQRLFVIFFFALVISMLIRHQEDFLSALRAAKGSFLPAIIAALFCEFFYQFTRSNAILSLYQFLGEKVSRKSAVLGYLLALTANVSLPSGGIAGGIIYRQYIASKHQIEKGKITFVSTFYTVLDYGSLAIYFLIGMTLLSLSLEGSSKNAWGAELTMIATLFVLLGILIIVIVHAKEILSLLGRLTLRLRESRLKRVLPTDTEIKNNVRHFITAGKETWRRKLELVPAIIWGAANNPFRMLCLWLVFFALGYSISLPVLVAGYTIGVISMAVSITPQGLGITEAVMPAVFTALNVPTGIATLGVLVYRFITFWLPFLVGAWQFRYSGFKISAN